MTSGMKSSEAAEKNLSRLLRGIATGHVETVRDTWRALLRDRPHGLPAILDRLDSPAWADRPRGPAVAYLGTLLALLHEIAPSAFADEIARLRATALHPAHRRTVNLLARRVEDRPVGHVAGDIPVYIAPEIARPDQLARLIARWSRTPGLDLAGVTRIDVIALAPELDYLGRYNLFFSGIVLTWPRVAPRGPALWWHDLNGEFTFYHEVGHHVCGHAEGGIVAEQEEEADAYARAAMRRARPIPTLIARAALLPFRPLLRRLEAALRADHPARRADG